MNGSNNGDDSLIDAIPSFPDISETVRRDSTWNDTPTTPASDGVSVHAPTPPEEPKHRSELHDTDEIPVVVIAADELSIDEPTVLRTADSAVADTATVFVPATAAIQSANPDATNMANDATEDAQAHATSTDFQDESIPAHEPATDSPKKSRRLVAVAVTCCMALLIGLIATSITVARRGETIADLRTALKKQTTVAGSLTKDVERSSKQNAELKLDLTASEQETAKLLKLGSSISPAAIAKSRLPDTATATLERTGCVGWSDEYCQSPASASIDLKCDPKCTVSGEAVSYVDVSLSRSGTATAYSGQSPVDGFSCGDSKITASVRVSLDTVAMSLSSTGWVANRITVVVTLDLAAGPCRAAQTEWKGTLS